ncbi:MAG TPA: hypothetical protein VM925_37765 [Labilithrix sp.]|nr:hypothetical protein [Labilithrix sp.]
MRSLLVIALSLAVGLGFLLTSPNALAQGKAEGPAKALQKKAMEEDYLATEFTKAQEKLEKAIAQCGTDKCSAQLRSRLKRDLGVVQIGGGIDKEKGIGNFAEAIKLDPAVTLDPDIKTKDLEAAFAEAKKRAGGGPSAPAAPPANGAATGGQPEGDFAHTPAAEQQVRTPIPVYAEYGGEEALTRVIARYKGFGMTDWKTVELKKMTEKGWGALLPCADVQQGTTQYYLQGFNANNDPVATGGDRNNPYRVPVKADKVEDPPHLPNASPPTQCADTGDCPPNFPGCKKAAVGPTASESTPEPSGKDGGEFCEEDSECKSGKCQDAKCTDYEGERKGPRFWVGVSGSLDLAFIPSTDDVCKLSQGKTPVNTDNYYCVNSNGSDYPSRATPDENNNLVPSSGFGNRGGDRVGGGTALGNIRLMLALDYALHPNWLLGARIGLVLNTYPGSEAETDGKRFAAPVHLELRTTYVFGRNALFKKGFAPYAFGGVGLASFETKVGTDVYDTTKLKPNGQPDPQRKDAWHLAGPAFIAFGGGGRYAVTPRFALTLGLRLNLAFLNAFAPSVGPELGGQIGF